MKFDHKKYLEKCVPEDKEFMKEFITRQNFAYFVEQVLATNEPNNNLIEFYKMCVKLLNSFNSLKKQQNFLISKALHHYRNPVLLNLSSCFEEYKKLLEEQDLTLPLYTKRMNCGILNEIEDRRIVEMPKLDVSKFKSDKNPLNGITSPIYNTTDESMMKETMFKSRNTGKTFRSLDYTNNTIESQAMGTYDSNNQTKHNYFKKSGSLSPEMRLNFATLTTSQSIGCNEDFLSRNTPYRNQLSQRYGSFEDTNNKIEAPLFNFQSGKSVHLINYNSRNNNKLSNSTAFDSLNFKTVETMKNMPISTPQIFPNMSQGYYTSQNTIKNHQSINTTQYQNFKSGAYQQQLLMNSAFSKQVGLLNFSPDINKIESAQPLKNAARMLNFNNTDTANQKMSQELSCPTPRGEKKRQISVINIDESGKKKDIMSTKLVNQLVKQASIKSSAKLVLNTGKMSPKQSKVVEKNDKMSPVCIKKSNSSMSPKTPMSHNFRKISPSTKKLEQNKNVKKSPHASFKNLNMSTKKQSPVTTKKHSCSPVPLKNVSPTNIKNSIKNLINNGRTTRNKKSPSPPPNLPKAKQTSTSKRSRSNSLDKNEDIKIIPHKIVFKTTEKKYNEDNTSANTDKTRSRIKKLSSGISDIIKRNSTLFEKDKQFKSSVTQEISILFSTEKENPHIKNIDGVKKRASIENIDDVRRPLTDILTNKCEEEESLSSISCLLSEEELRHSDKLRSFTAYNQYMPNKNIITLNTPKHSQICLLPKLLFDKSRIKRQNNTRIHGLNGDTDIVHSSSPKSNSSVENELSEDEKQIGSSINLWNLNKFSYKE